MAGQAAATMIGRRPFLGAVAALLCTGRWTRPAPAPEPVISIVTANGFSVPPSHPMCRCVVETWTTPYPYLEPGDVVQLTLPGERSALFTLVSSRDHGRRMTLREI